MAKPTQTLPETRIRYFHPPTRQPQVSHAACPSAPNVGKQALPRTRAGFLQESRASVRPVLVHLLFWTRLALKVPSDVITERVTSATHRGMGSMMDRSFYGVDPMSPLAETK